MFRKFGLNILFLLLALSAGAQSYRFKQITSEDGLSTNYIQCILQDKKGFMWFGTQEGLCRYDGYNITTFKHNIADKNSISSSDVVCLFEDTDGNHAPTTYLRRPGGTQQDSCIRAPRLALLLFDSFSSSLGVSCFGLRVELFCVLADRSLRAPSEKSPRQH